MPSTEIGRLELLTIKTKRGFRSSVFDTLAVARDYAKSARSDGFSASVKKARARAGREGYSRSYRGWRVYYYKLRRKR